ncbi:MAG: GTP cyclohydrolase I FolE [Elusimicrobiaceae bacterium]|jgi:GTP cyclohydrolase I
MELLFRDFFNYIGDSADRPELADTPYRVIKSWEKLYGGYAENPDRIFKLFKCDDNNELIILRDIDFYSTCEHHLLPFFGEIHVGYIPDGKITGISKLARVCELFARRLQLQERLVNNIADEIEKRLCPKGVIVTAKAQHFCMTSRGIQKQKTKMITTATRGLFKNHERRTEFFRMLSL